MMNATFRRGMGLVVVAAALAGCRRNLQTANDPFLNDHRDVASRPASDAPPRAALRTAPDDPFASNAKPQTAARTSSPSSPHMAGRGTNHAPADPFASEPRPRPSGVRTASAEGIPPSGQVTAARFPSETPLETNSRPAAGAKPRPTAKPAASAERKPARPVHDNPFESSDNPFESAAPSKESAPDSHHSNTSAPFPDEAAPTPSPKPRAAARPRSTRKPGESPFGVSTPPEESEDPFGDPSAKAPASSKSASNDDPFLDPPAPPTPRNTARSKAPTPEEEEFEENPFAPSTARRKPRATAPAPVSEPEESAPEASVPSEEESPFESTEKPTRPRGTAPRSTGSRFLPMPAPDESGWRPATPEAPAQDDAEENPWR